MGFVDWIILAVIVLIVAVAALFIIRAKKKGQACIGCPHSNSCRGGCGCTGK